MPQILGIIGMVLKDALLCLFICATLANLMKNKKTSLISLVIIIVLFMMGIDM